MEVRQSWLHLITELFVGRTTPEGIVPTEIRPHRKGASYKGLNSIPFGPKWYDSTACYKCNPIRLPMSPMYLQNYNIKLPINNKAYDQKQSITPMKLSINTLMRNGTPDKRYCWARSPAMPNYNGTKPQGKLPLLPEASSTPEQSETRL